jgi:hypothetical protein
VPYSNINCWTSDLGEKRTSEHVHGMSDLPPKADIEDAMKNVRFVPKADIGSLAVFAH